MLNRRIFTIDLSKNYVSNDSLFANIGFRVYEFQNRLVLGDALEAGGVKDNPMLPVMSEHLFSLTQKNKKSHLIEKNKEHTIIYFSNKKELMAYSKEGNLVSPRNKELFVKWLRYAYGRHPDILEKLLSNNVIPKKIRIHQYNIANEVNTLTISTIRSKPETNFSMEGYSTEIEETDQIYYFLNKQKYSTKLELEKTLNKLLSNAINHFEAGNYLDTMLVYLEYYLSSGRPFPKIYQEQASEIKTNEDVQLLLRSLSPKSKEDAENFLNILQKIEPKSKHQSHIIKIFKANILESLGKPGEAKKLFFESLKKSPYITGVYKDLGDIYYKEYNAVMA